MITRLLAGAPLVVTLSVACTTEPCACSEPGSRVVLYGVTSLEATGAPVAGAVVGVIMSNPAFDDEACSVPIDPAPDAPAPVTANASGGFRLEIFSIARSRRCVILHASRDAPGPPLARTLEPISVSFGTPSTTDSLRIDLPLRPE